MSKFILKNETYKKFVISHIFRPFQSMVVNIEGDKPISDMNYYSLIPKWCANNQEWERDTFSRIAAIYSKIEKSIFPDDVVSLFIQEKLKEYGVELI